MKILTFVGLSYSDHGPATLDLDVLNEGRLQFAISRSQIFALNEQAVNALLKASAHRNYPEATKPSTAKETTSGA